MVCSKKSRRLQLKNDSDNKENGLEVFFYPFSGQSLVPHRPDEEIRKCDVLLMKKYSLLRVVYTSSEYK